MERKLRVCSLFSGCGGLDVGFIQAGFEVVFAIDSYVRACESYILNLGLPIVNKNIQDISYEDIPDCDVIMTARECARLQSFPDSFHFCGPLTAQIKQIGNAVLPLISYRIAQAIKASI